MNTPHLVAMVATNKKEKQVMTYRNWIENWIERKSPMVKESTFAAYSNILVNHLLPKFGGLELSEITEERMQEYVFALVKGGRLDGRGGLNPRSAKDVLIVLKTTLRDAMRAKELPRTVYDVRVPAKRHVDRVPLLDRKDQERLMQAIYLDFSSKSAGILLCLYTGLRIGELCALQWKDIDFENKMLHVRQTVQRIYRKQLNGIGRSKVVIGAPKSRTSARTIPLASILLPVLERLRAEDGETFFIGGRAKCSEVRTYREFYDRFLARNNLAHIRFHALRHTFATRCIEAGGDCKTVSELLGHSTVNLTLNLYVHPQMEQKRQCIDKLSF